MEIKGIDVSSWQDKPDWSKVAASGIRFAILRVTEHNGIDSSFEHNFKGCRANGIPIGVYKYSYALSVADIKAEADGVVEALAGRGLDFPVWLDLEYDEQRKLGASALETMIKTFWSVITSAGYKFGIYCNTDWYNNVLPASVKGKYDFWLAAYPASDTGAIVERLRPSEGVGWQYSSKGRVPGISGPVDLNVFYKDYTEGTEDTGMAKDLWTQTAELMAAQTGYLEKASNYNLDSKTGNAGYNNYTKYARDVNSWGQPGCQGQAWCAVYQFWINVKIFGLAKALQIMGGGFYNCTSITNHAKKNGTWHSTPKLGALIIFRNGAHIGRVTEVTSTQVYTNEGNTSKGGTNNVVANGGCVADKVYTRNYASIDGYVWIDYGTESESGSTSTAGKLNTAPKWTGEVTASELNVRSWAGTEYPTIKKWPLLKRTNRVDVCDSIKAADGSTWHYVRIAGKYYGFVHGTYIARV